MDSSSSSDSKLITITYMIYGVSRCLWPTTNVEVPQTQHWRFYLKDEGSWWSILPPPNVVQPQLNNFRCVLSYKENKLFMSIWLSLTPIMLFFSLLLNAPISPIRNLLLNSVFCTWQDCHLNDFSFLFL